MEQARYLILEDGHVFKGKPFGASGQAVGEIVFTTAMTGYLETLTDPSYYGQMVVLTFPLIGNYGVIPGDFEGKAPTLKAYIVRSWCQEPSNFRSEEDLDTFLIRQGVVGLWDIDTRALVKIIRERGVMNAVVGDEPELCEETLRGMREYSVTNAVNAVTCAGVETQRGDRTARNVVLWDFGAKRNIARELVKRGCAVTTVPADTAAEEILALKPDGVMLSNGPGDPAENNGVIRELDNDYIYFDCFDQQIEAPESLSVYLSEQHAGIGGDGVILICPSEIADAKMRIFNRDGSEGRMCGNGIRCVGKYLYDNGMADKTDLTIETLSGVMRLKLYVRGGKVKSVTVDMGRASLAPAQVPVLLEGGGVVGRTVSIEGNEYEITCVSMGNPHCVVFVENPDLIDIGRVGPAFEHAPIFPDRTNTEFVKVIDSHTLKMRVWERGSGETLACGTGACAAVVAAVENGYCEKGEDITVRLRGGDLLVRYTDEAVWMTGDARKSFEGVVEL